MSFNMPIKTNSAYHGWSEYNGIGLANYVLKRHSQQHENSKKENVQGTVYSETPPHTTHYTV